MHVNLLWLLGFVIVICLIWYVLQAFGSSLPPLVFKLLCVVVVVVAVILLCQGLGIPLPGLSLTAFSLQHYSRSLWL